MKKIYLILMNTHTIPSRLVRIFTMYRYTHVALSLDKDCYKIYSFGRKSIHNILKGGFTIEKQNGEFFQKFDKTICKIYELQVSNKQYYKINKNINNMVKNKEIYKYDLLGAILRFFKIPIKRKNKYVCSSFLAYLLEDSNTYKFNKKTCFVKPKDITKIDSLKEIYCGYYKQYT